MYKLNCFQETNQNGNEVLSTSSPALLLKEKGVFADQVPGQNLK
jgi:hypothetical protein